MKKLGYMSILLIGFACSTHVPHEFDAQALIDQAIFAHGANLSEKKVSFDFRDRTYTLRRGKGSYTYIRAWQDDSLGFVQDILINSKEFTRFQDGDSVALDDEWAAKYASSVNSVFYFFQIPFVLNDGGAIKQYEGKFEISDEPYHAVKVSFSENGGGEDHEDLFMYWIHKEFSTIDFFAYSYTTDGGGVRFREAINRRKAGGLLIQDYVNYEAEKGTPLKNLPELFEQGNLKVLSRIENTKVKVH
ncbi:MAG: hypothetical protein GY816_08615 [Cytophagales bacterium]|nr:hypothetical protein [Cytophagales bacterium]